MSLMKCRSAREVHGGKQGSIQSLLSVRTFYRHGASWVCSLIAGLLLSSCVHDSASPPDLYPGILDPIEPGPPLAIRNGQPSTDEIEVGDAGLGRSVEANLHEWTDAAIEVLAEAFEEHGIIVDDQASRYLEVSIADVSLHTTMWAFHSRVRIRASTSRGYGASYSGEASSWKFANACDEAVTNALALAVRDPVIQRFLGSVRRP